jgi:hypothetical protein
MEIPKLIRFLLGSAGVIMTGFLLYCVWRLYAYFYLERKQSPPKVGPLPQAPPKKIYRAPRFLYDSGKHEFYVRQE